MKKTIIIVAGMIVALVIAFFVYDIMKSVVSPCETIFEQTSIQLGSKLKILQTQGELVIGKEKIQDLTETAQVTALNLKTCCIVLNAAKVDSSQFLQCKDAAKEYEAKVDNVLANVEKAEEARKTGKTEVLEQSIRAVNRSVDDATRLSEEFQQQVNTLSGGEQQETNTKPVASSAQVSTQSTLAPTRKPATDSALKLSTILSTDSEAVSKDLKYTVYKAKKNLEGKREQVTNSYDPVPQFKLPAGRYFVSVSHGQAYASMEVEVSAGEITEQTLNLHAGYLRLFSIVAQGVEPVARDLRYSIYTAKKDLEGKRRQVTNSYDSVPLFRLPAGRYFVSVSHGQAYASIEVEVSAGELTEQTLNLNAGYLKLSSIAAQDSQPVARDLKYFVYEAKKDRDGKRKQITNSYDAAPLFRLAAGRYYIMVEHRGTNASAEVEIVEGQREKVILKIYAEGQGEETMQPPAPPIAPQILD